MEQQLPLFARELAPTEQQTVRTALTLLERQLREPGASFTSGHAVRDWLRLQLATLEREEFTALFLDNQHRLIAHVTLFTGTINHTQVHPREVVKAALKHNAAAILVAHCHPSGLAEPSDADRRITKRLKQALDLACWTIWWSAGWILSLLPNAAGCKENNDENHQQTPGNDDLPSASSFPPVSLLYREIPVVRQYLSLCRPGGTGYRWRAGRIR